MAVTSGEVHSAYVLYIRYLVRQFLMVKTVSLPLGLLGSSSITIWSTARAGSSLIVMPWRRRLRPDTWRAMAATSGEGYEDKGSARQERITPKLGAYRF
jgi:hypothetical protein